MAHWNSENTLYELWTLYRHPGLSWERFLEILHDNHAPSLEEQWVIWQWARNASLGESFVQLCLHWLALGQPVHWGAFWFALEGLGFPLTDQFCMLSIQSARQQNALNTLMIHPLARQWSGELAQLYSKTQSEALLAKQSHWLKSLDEATIFRTQGLLESAKQKVNEVLRALPNHQLAQKLLSEVQIEIGLQLLNQKREPSARINRTRTPHPEADLPQAELNKILESLTPPPRDKIYDRAILFIQADLWKEAAKCLSPIIIEQTFDEKEAWLYFEVLKNQRLFFEAYRFLQNEIRAKFLSLDRPHDWLKYHYAVAEIYIGLQLYHLAKKSLELVISVDPDYRQALSLLELCQNYD